MARTRGPRTRAHTHKHTNVMLQAADTINRQLGAPYQPFAWILKDTLSSQVKRERKKRSFVILRPGQIAPAWLGEGGRVSME